MSFDMRYLWQIINSCVDRIQNFFNSLIPQMEQITNTGQGIYQGLVHSFSILWDAIIKALDVFGKWVKDAFEWIKSGFEAFGKWIYDAFKSALEWIGSGLAWIGSQIYNFGNWIWSGIVWIAKQFWKALVGIINWVGNVVNYLVGEIGAWWDNTANYINSWFTNLMVSFRKKLKTSIMANIAIIGGWKSAERIISAKSPKDWLYGLTGIFASPIVGAIFGEIIDAIIPSTTIQPVEIIPRFGRLTISLPEAPLLEEPLLPTPETGEIPGYPPSPPEVSIPLVEETAEIESSYDYVYSPSQERVSEIESSYEVLLGASLERVVEVGSVFGVERTSPLERVGEMESSYEVEVTPLIPEIERVAEIESSVSAIPFEHPLGIGLTGEVVNTTAPPQELELGIGLSYEVYPGIPLTATVESSYEVSVSIPPYAHEVAEIESTYEIVAPKLVEKIGEIESSVETKRLVVGGVGEIESYYTWAVGY